MEYRTLGKTGLKVSSVGVGCWQMGGLVGASGWTGTTDEESIATVHRAQEIGVNLLDTAEGYGQGHSEEVLGKALKGRRDRFIIATKVRPSTDDPDEGKARVRILEACEGSLRRLQTDVIDVYQLHAIPHENTMSAVMETLAALKQQGKIRWFGISTNDTAAIRKLLALGDLATLQVGYNLLSRSGEEALRLAKEENLGALIRVPLASGALSGRYFNAAPKLDPKDRRLDRFTSEKALDVFRKLSELLFLTEGGKRTMVQAALRFILDTEGVTSAIPGAKSRQQLEDNADAMDAPPLTPEERARAIRIAEAAGTF
ncbi:MAG: aldo/keto reductase [Candidatus Latescibacteria bacterium]|nr:aldo/keto reductase [Candidatus Latescibacterota bacterium]